MPQLIGRDPNQVPTNGMLGRMAWQSPDGVQVNGGVVTAQMRPGVVTKTAAFTLADTEHRVICNGSASITATLPSAVDQAGREFLIKTIAAFTVVSASANVVPLAGGAAGTAILPATAGKWALLVSDGASWVIMAAG